MKREQPNIEELPERQVAFVSFTGNYMDNPHIFANVFNQLRGWAGPKGLISPTSVFLSSYQNDPRITLPDELKLDVCISVSKDTEVDGDIQKKVFPGGKYAVMRAEATGPEEYGPVWNAVVEWMEKNGYEVDFDLGRDQ